MILIPIYLFVHIFSCHITEHEFLLLDLDIDFADVILKVKYNDMYRDFKEFVFHFCYLFNNDKPVYKILQSIVLI